MVRIAEETDPEILRQAALLLDAENRRLIEFNVRLQLEIIALKGLDPATAQLKIELLEQQLAQARQSLFGRSSERREGEDTQPGYHAYEAVARQSGAGVRLVFCWAHVRRKFVEIENFYPAECKQIIGLIRDLYAVEDECPEGPPGDDLRRLLRRERSRAVLDRISEWVFATYPRQLPESTLAKAIKYMGSRCAGLTRFIDDPCVPLDNNATERVLRSVVVGRKNHYGSKSRRGTEVAALYYSLLESAKLAGLEPRGYLLNAVLAALRRQPVKLPHELAAEAAAKTQAIA